MTWRSVRISPAPRQVGHGCDGISPAAAALGARPVDGEAALAERDRPAAVALGAGGPGGARRAARAGAGGAGLGHLQRRPAPCRPAPRPGTAPRRRSRSPPRARRPPVARGRRSTRRCRPARRSRRSPCPRRRSRDPRRPRSAPPAPDRGPRAMPPSNAPSRRIWSYCFRLSASDRTLCASEISLKRSAACGLLGLASGWYCLASRRYAFLISAWLAESGTPRT